MRVWLALIKKTIECYGTHVFSSLLYMFGYSMFAYVLASSPLAVLIVVPHGAKMCSRPLTVTVPNRRPFSRCFVCVSCFNIAWMDVNLASIFSVLSMTVTGGMAVGWDWALPSNKALVHTSCIFAIVVAEA